MRFSVIVPVYNVENYLRQCLDSLLCQKYQDYEIIIVDDGSTDGSGQIADEYARRWPEQVKVIHQANKGLGGARNTGMEIAGGEYLTFVDSDDYVAPVFLERLDQALGSGSFDVLVFNMRTASENGTPQGPMFAWEKEFEQIDSKEFINQEPSAVNKVYKRQFFDKTGVRFPNHLLYEDLATIPMLAIWEPKIGRINDCLYFYRQRRNSIMRETDSKKMLQIIDAMERTLMGFKKENAYEKYYPELEWAALRHVLCRGCGRLLLPIDKTDWQAIEELNRWMNENFPNFRENRYYMNSQENPEDDYMRGIIEKRYKYVQRKYYGWMRFKKRIKRILIKSKVLKE